MPLIHSDQTFTLDGVNNFTVGGTTLSWGNGFIGDLDIFSNDPAPASYTVTATMTGSNWSIGRFAVGGDDKGAGTVVRAVINDDTSGSNRFIEQLNLYGIGGNVVTLNHTDVMSIAGSNGIDTVTSNTNFVGSIQLFGGNDSVTVNAGNADMVNLGDGTNRFTSTNGHVSALIAYGGNDTAIIGAGGADAINLGGGNNNITVNNGGFTAAIRTYGGNDIFHVNGDVDVIDAGSGNNRVFTSNVV